MTDTNAASFPVRVLPRLLRGAAQLVCPAVCPLCRARPAVRGTLCPACEAGIERLGEPRCTACGGTVDGVLNQCGECLRLEARPWQHAVSAFPFGGTVRGAIHRFKYRNQTSMAPWLGCSMAASWRHYGAGTPELVVPVPLHWTRQVTRGYNQVELLAAVVARDLGLPLQRALKRRRRTAQQASLDAKARQRNLTNVFTVCNTARTKDKHVLLLDDVLTTGATLAEATHVLLNAGSATVSVLTAARG